MKKTGRMDLMKSAVVGLVVCMLLAACNPLDQLTDVQQPGSQTEEIPSTGSESGQPSVNVNNQQYDGTTVEVTNVVSVGPGWMVIHNEENGVLGPPIGFTQLQPGENQNVKVKIDPALATSTMYAMLHADEGVVGKYEFPGPDVPVMVEGQMISPPFTATKLQEEGSVLTPAVVVENQVVKNGKVTIAEVDTNSPGWVAIHIQGSDGKPGDDIGYSAVKAGKNTNLVVIVDPGFVTPVMYAMLHTDAGEIGIYEFPGPDEPQTFNNAMIAPAFSTDGQALASPGSDQAPTATSQAAAQAATATAPAAATATAADTGMVMGTAAPGINPVVKASDQILVNNSVKIDQVVSGGPGWIVIYTTTSSGQPDQAIGHAPVNAGENINLLVPVDPAKATGSLYAQLHVDAGTSGTFEFPGPDDPLMIGVQMIAGTFKVTAQQASGSNQPAAPTPTALVASIKVADQPIENSSVIIPEVISNGDAWLVIHRQNGDGSMGSMVGNAAVKDGINSNVVVKVDTNFTSTTLYAMLHQDLGIKGKLEFPGPDEPVMVNNQMVAPAFVITYDRLSDVIVNISRDRTLNNFLVDGNEMSLYIFLKDERGKSNCTGDCLNDWKPLLATGRIIAGSGIASDKLGVYIRPDGTRQVTYAGAPLYTYVQDKQPGDINGQGIDGAWFLAAP